MIFKCHETFYFAGSLHLAYCAMLNVVWALDFSRNGLGGLAGLADYIIRVQTIESIEAVLKTAYYYLPVPEFFYVK